METVEREIRKPRAEIKWKEGHMATGSEWRRKGASGECISIMNPPKCPGEACNFVVQDTGLGAEV